MRLDAPARPTPPRHPGRPNVWPAARPGLGLGEWQEVENDFFPTVATEFGRGWNGRATDVVATALGSLYYEAMDDAAEAARVRSQGAFLGAVAIGSANFLGVELHRLGVRHVMGADKPPVYEFESLAATVDGRRQLERTFKLGMDHHAVVDGEWTAVRTDAAGNVQLLATADYLAQLRADQPH